MSELVQISDGEASVIVNLCEAAMHMYSAAIADLPDPSDPGFADRAAVILAGLRKLVGALTEAASRSRPTPWVSVALGAARARYDELMATAANCPRATIGQRLYTTRVHARLSISEAANGIGVRPDLIAAIEAEEPATEDEALRIKELIDALGG